MSCDQALMGTTAPGRGRHDSIWSCRWSSTTMVTMTQPLLAHQTPAGRMYARSTRDAPQVPSITTVIAQQPADLTGWASYMATQALITDTRLPQALGSGPKLKALARHANEAASQYRDQAAERGDRVHYYAEQVARAQLGQSHQVPQARQLLAEHAETAFADRFDEWWDNYQVRALAAEVTVWNHTVGYAGTLDLVAEIGGRICLIDYKTKGTTRDGRVKPLDEKVVMQLTAGMKAEESLRDADQGSWVPWEFGHDAVLLAVALGETEAVAYQARPEVLADHWRKFWSLRQAWEYARVVENTPAALRPIAPPARAR